MDRVTGLTVGFRAPAAFGTACGFGDLTWRDFAGSARAGACLTPCLAGVVLVTGAADFDFCATFGLGVGFCTALGLTAGFGAAFGFTAGFFAAAFGFTAGFFGAALDFTAGFGFGAAFFGAALGLAGFFTALGAATRVLFAPDDFGAASAS